MESQALSCTTCTSEGAAPLWDPSVLPVSWRPAGIRPVHFQPGQILFEEGAHAHSVYCLKSGLVKLYKHGARGEPFIIRLLGRGRLIGYRPVLAAEPYAATAEVVAEAWVCAIPQAVFEDLIVNSWEVARRLLRHTAWELRVSEEQLLFQVQQTVRERTIRLLALFLAECPTGCARNIPIHLPLQRKEFAQMVGTSPESLSRTLHRLAEAGLLRLTRREIFVRDPAKLREEASRLLGST